MQLFNVLSFLFIAFTSADVDQVLPATKASSEWAKAQNSPRVLQYKQEYGKVQEQVGRRKIMFANGYCIHIRLIKHI